MCGRDSISTARSTVSEQAAGVAVGLVDHARHRLDGAYDHRAGLRTRRATARRSSRTRSRCRPRSYRRPGRRSAVRLSSPPAARYPASSPRRTADDDQGDDVHPLAVALDEWRAHSRGGILQRFGGIHPPARSDSRAAPDPFIGEADRIEVACWRCALRLWPRRYRRCPRSCRVDQFSECRSGCPRCQAVGDSVKVGLDCRTPSRVRG